jgi:hypothetical protein
LNTIAYTDDSAKKNVETFCDQVFWIKKIRRLFKELFENEQAVFLMDKTALSFFNDVGEIVHKYLLLECAKITDPAETYKNENLTVDNLIESINWPEDVMEELTLLRDEKISPFRRYIRDARIKLLAHNDKQTVLAERKLGEFPEEGDMEFLKALEKFCNIIHKACFGEIYGQMVTGSQGDVLDLKKALEYAVAFRKLLSESSGQEKVRLHSLVDELRNHSDSNIE